MVHPRSEARARRRAPRAPHLPLDVVQRLDGMTSSDQAWQWLAGLTPTELIATCRSLGLDATGTATSVIGRIVHGTVGAREDAARADGRPPGRTVGRDADRVRAHMASPVAAVGTTIQEMLHAFAQARIVLAEHAAGIAAHEPIVAATHEATGTEEAPSTPRLASALDALGAALGQAAIMNQTVDGAVLEVIAALEQAMILVGQPAAEQGASGPAEAFQPVG